MGADRSIIAIDDISIVSGDCTNPETDLFKCSATESIAKSKVCDGTKDCSNGADEADCGSCDFSNNYTCGFTLRK